MRKPPFVVASLLGLLACNAGSSHSGFVTTKNANTPDKPSGTLGSSGDPAAAPTGETCAATVNNATRAEVDVILVIDTSGSMSEETDQVKQNLNAFAQSIGNTGLDYNVILVAEKWKKPIIPIPGVPASGICVPPPLGGANCGDNPPRFHIDDHVVASDDSLKILLERYDKYSKWLRPTAYKVFIEVTDDNSALAFDEFDKQLLAKDLAQFGTSDARRYIFNSICGFQRGTAPLSDEKCSSAVNTGDVYQHLSQLTGGTIDSVCETSYASVFDNIAKGLITKLGCEFAIPKAPDGSPTDPGTVVVTYTPGGVNSGKPLTQVTDASKCGANPDGWYYDDLAAPTKILFCPSTCTGAGADTAGKLEVAVGCDAPPPR